MKISPMERKVLWAAIEDYVGLWEIIWELASSCPEIPESDRKSFAERAVRCLIARNCLQLYERSEIGGKEQLVSRARWDELLSDEANWGEPSSRSIEVLLGATNAGEKLYAMDACD
jgi:hypothetical protein